MKQAITLPAPSPAPPAHLFPASVAFYCRCAELEWILLTLRAEPDLPDRFVPTMNTRQHSTNSASEHGMLCVLTVRHAFAIKARHAQHPHTKHPSSTADTRCVWGSVPTLLPAPDRILD